MSIMFSLQSSELLQIYTQSGLKLEKLLKMNKVILFNNQYCFV